MTIESAMDVAFFVLIGILVMLYGHIWLKLRKAVRKGDADAVCSWTRGLLVSKSFRERMILKALDNKAKKELAEAKQRRRDVVKLLSKIPGIQITRTGLEEEDSAQSHEET